MNTRLFLPFFALVALAFASPLWAEEPQASPTTTEPVKADHESIERLGLRGNVMMAGAELSETLSTTTGMAISPLIGVSAVGAYTYFSAEKEMRDQLPWWAHPYAWGIGAALIAFSFLRDSLGAALPTLIRKPLHILDSVEDKISALVAGLAVTPSLYYVGEAFFIQNGWLSPAAEPEAMVASVMLGGVDITMDDVTRALLAFGSMVAFGVVWLVSHAVNLLVVLSPFREVDVVLKSLKVGFLATYAGMAFWIPEIRLVLAILLIVLCIPFFGWAYRLNVFGSLLTFDFFRKLFRRTGPPKGQPVVAFATGDAIEGVPARSYGKLDIEKATGLATFHYRTLPFLPRKTVRVGGAGRHSVIQKGVIFPGLAIADEPKAGFPESLRRVFNFRFAYRGHEEGLAEVLHQEEIREIATVRGIRAAWHWVKTQVLRSKEATLRIAEKANVFHSNDSKQLG